MSASFYFLKHRIAIAVFHDAENQHVYLFRKQRLEFLLIEKAVSVCIWMTRENFRFYYKLKLDANLLVKKEREKQNLTMKAEESFGVKIVRVETICFLPHLFQLILAALKLQKHTRHAATNILKTSERTRKRKL